MTAIANGLLLIAAVGLFLIALQVASALVHLAQQAPLPQRMPGVSILKPLCGIDDDLRQNLASFADLRYRRYEVLLGVRDVSDPAYPIARQAAERWPDRMRVVIQRGEPGLNPKVNQLLTLAEGAAHDILVVSDSNVAVEPDYLLEIAAHLERPEVGIVTHPIAGVGERSWGALMDNGHLSTSITPGMIGAKKVADFAIVVGKSMAMRRADVVALGGFEAVKDVLAEDFVMGTLVREELGKDVAVARRPILAVSRDRTVGSFYRRYKRWATIQRYSVGPLQYAALIALNPLVFAVAAFALAPTRSVFAALLLCWLAKALLEGAAALAVNRSSAFGARHLLALPLKDALLFAAWVWGIGAQEVDWRGTRLAVRSGTRLEPVVVRTGLPGFPGTAAPLRSGQSQRNMHHGTRAPLYCHSDVTERR